MKNRAVLFFLFTLMIVVSLSSCGKSKVDEKSFFLMDTIVTVKSTDVSDELVWQCEDRIYEIESAISKTAKESDVYKFNRSDESLDLSSDSAELISRVLSLCPVVNGAYDPTLASVSELWDITGEARIPKDNEISDALLHTGYQKLSLDGSSLSKSDPELKLDLGGAGKGYACEKAVELLSASDGYGLVSFGSSIGVFGNKPDEEPWNIAITDPYDPSSTVGYVSIESGYVTVSGDYERYAEIDGVRYTHIIDPKTGRPLSNGVHSVVIISDDAVVGDVLSTALMIAGEEGITEFKNAGIEFEALMISDRGYMMTDNMKEILTLYEEKK